MKATGIVRRIDDLGRVVIPKEIRRVLRIREGGLGCRLGRCFCTVHRGVHRTPAPFSRNQKNSQADKVWDIFLPIHY